MDYFHSVIISLLLSVFLLQAYVVVQGGLTPDYAKWIVGILGANVITLVLVVVKDLYPTNESGISEQLKEILNAILCQRGSEK